MANSNLSVPERKLDFMYEVLSKKFERQNTNYSSLVTKGSFLFAFVGSFLAAYLGFVFIGDKSSSVIWGSIPGFLLFAMDLYCVYQVLKARTYKDPPPIDEFFKTKTLKMGIVLLKNTTISSIDSCYKTNATTLDNMAKWFNRGLWWLIITFVTIVVINTYIYGNQNHKSSLIPQAEQSKQWQQLCPSPTPAASTQDQRRGAHSCKTLPGQRGRR